MRDNFRDTTSVISHHHALLPRLWESVCMKTIGLGVVDLRQPFGSYIQAHKDTVPGDRRLEDIEKIHAAAISGIYHVFVVRLKCHTYSGG
jgi:hypothetical protein